MSKFDAFGRILSKVYTIDSGECVNDILLLEDLATIY